jgi:hypothetical protein
MKNVSHAAHAHAHTHTGNHAENTPDNNTTRKKSIRAQLHPRPENREPKWQIEHWLLSPPARELGGFDTQPTHTHRADTRTEGSTSKMGGAVRLCADCRCEWMKACEVVLSGWMGEGRGREGWVGGLNFGTQKRLSRAIHRHRHTHTRTHTHTHTHTHHRSSLAHTNRGVLAHLVLALFEVSFLSPPRLRRPIPTSLTTRGILRGRWRGWARVCVRHTLS